MQNDTDRTAYRRRGMSLLELLLVLMLIGILAGFAILAAGRSRARGDLARLTAEARNFRLAQELYRGDAGHMYGGPFTPQAIKAAGFTYTPPSDVTITIESANDTTWAATLTGAANGAGAQALRPVCRISLRGVPVACGLLPQGWYEQLPDGSGSSGAPPGDVTPPR